MKHTPGKIMMRGDYLVTQEGYVIATLEGSFYTASDVSNAARLVKGWNNLCDKGE